MDFTFGVVLLVTGESGGQEVLLRLFNGFVEDLNPGILFFRSAAKVEFSSLCNYFKVVLVFLLDV